MYNPVNMHVEDEERLKEKDQREKNKKKRYEVRYDFEQVTRKEQLAEQDRLENMALNKIKFERVKEEVNRGFNILTNGDLHAGLSKLESTKYMKPPIGVWQKLNSPETKGRKETEVKQATLEQI